MLVALHLDEVLAFAGRHHRKVWTFTVVIGVLMVLWYMLSVWWGSSIEDASDQRAAYNLPGPVRAVEAAETPLHRVSDPGRFSENTQRTILELQ